MSESEDQRYEGRSGEHKEDKRSWYKRENTLMVIFNGLLVLVTALLVVTGIAQWRTMNAANEDVRLATEVANQPRITVNRAWLGSDLPSSAGQVVTFDVQFISVGGLATGVNGSVEAGVINDAIPEQSSTVLESTIVAHLPEDKPFSQEAVHDFVQFLNTFGTLDFAVSTPALSEPDILQLKGGHAVAYIYGRVDYSSTYRHYWLSFCRLYFFPHTKLGGSAGITRACPTNNRYVEERKQERS